MKLETPLLRASLYLYSAVLKPSKCPKNNNLIKVFKRSAYINTKSGRNVMKIP